MTGLWIAVAAVGIAVAFLALVLAAVVRRIDALRGEVAALSERLDPADGAEGGPHHNHNLLKIQTRIAGIVNAQAFAADARRAMTALD